MSDPIPPAARPGGEGTPKCEHCGAVMDSAFADLCAECAAKNNRRIADYAAGLRCLMCGHALNATDAPATVSAPAGEATRTQFDYLLNAFEQASQHDQPATQGYGEKRRALFAYVRALESRSSSPASGAPDEDRLSRLLDLLEDSDVHQRAIALDPADALILRRYVSSQAARLAASERAGVAMREALLGNDPAMPPALQPLSTIETAIALACDMAIQDHGESDEDYESVWSALMDARQACKTLRAALSPTSPAPSPEERANG